MNRTLLVGAAISVFFLPSARSEALSPDAGAVTEVVKGFHDALHRGDAKAAMELLAPDAVILESGESQTRAEYEREHLTEDIEFASATKTERSPVAIRQEGNVAWTTATSKTTGSFKDHKIDSTGVELMVLTKDKSGWHIRALHWSTRKTKQ